MQPKNSIMKYLMVATTVGIIFTSCKKEEKDTDTNAASDHALSEGTFNDVNNISDEAAKGSLSSYMTPGTSDSGERGLLSSCATITHDSVSNPRVLTIDFGTTNCFCGDNRFRRGIIKVSYSGKYRDSASTHTISFNNYFVNDNQVLGTKTVTNNGHNTAGNLNYSISVNGQIIKANGGGTITWTSTRNREWIAGESTPTWLDDVYLISGSANGTSASGNSFTANTTTPLRKEIGYKHIVSGILNVTPSGKATRILNFGNGTRDDQATVTINGNTYNITLH
ncbi:MAG: hypothetical protein ACT4ON_16585 [Bacteroidota bacterium]